MASLIHMDKLRALEYCIAAAQENFLNRGVWPGASGWERKPGDVATPADLPRLNDVVRAMAGR